METEGKERCSTRSDIQSGPEGVRAVLRGMQMAQSIFYMDALRSAALPCIQENSGLSPRFSFVLCGVLPVLASPSVWLYYTPYNKYVKYFDELFQRYAKNRHRMPIFTFHTLTALLVISRQALHQTPGWLFGIFS